MLAHAAKSWKPPLAISAAWFQAFQLSYTLRSKYASNPLLAANHRTSTRLSRHLCVELSSILSLHSCANRSTAGSYFSSKMSEVPRSEFRLSDRCTLHIQIGDITKWCIDGISDAIVNPANERMLGGGGADGAIHKAAGEELKEACKRVPEVEPGIRCPTGEARITGGFKLQVSHVIHTVGPIYGTNPNPKASLTNAYRNSLKLAEENNINFIAFPAISCGVYMYPHEEAAEIALLTVRDFGKNFKEVHFVLFSDEMLNIWLGKAEELLDHDRQCLPK